MSNNTVKSCNIQLSESFSSNRSRRRLLRVLNPQRIIRCKRFLQRNDARILFLALALVHFFVATELWIYTLGDTATSVIEHPELGSWERRWRFLKATHPIVSSLVLECTITLQATAIYAAVRNRPKLLFAYLVASGLFSLLLFTVGLLGGLYHYVYGFSHKQMHQWWMVEHHQQLAHHYGQHDDEGADDERVTISSQQALYMFLVLGLTIVLLAVLHQLADRLYHEALRKRAQHEERFGSHGELDCSKFNAMAFTTIPTAATAAAASTSQPPPPPPLPMTGQADSIAIRFD